MRAGSFSAAPPENEEFASDCASDETLGDSAGMKRAFKPPAVIRLTFFEKKCIHIYL